MKSFAATLVPTFRSSCTASAPTFHELRKVIGTSRLIIPVPLFHLKFLDGVRRLWRRNFKWAALMAGLALAVSAGAASAQISDDVVKIGVLTDMSSLYADATGKGSVAAVQMALDDYKGKLKVEMIA